MEQRVGDDWEYQGHYLGISLVSVIMQYYSGLMRIIPNEKNGNSFLLSFPLELVE